MKTVFAQDDAGEYYKLKDGTYTKTPSTETTADKYESTTQKYKKSTQDDTTIQDSKTVTVEGTVDDNGYVIFSGLGEGVYKIRETYAPDGYNIDPNEYTITIGSNPTKDDPAWSPATPGADNDYTVATQEAGGAGTANGERRITQRHETSENDCVLPDSDACCGCCRSCICGGRFRF